MTIAEGFVNNVVPVLKTRKNISLGSNLPSKIKTYTSSWTSICCNWECPFVAILLSFFPKYLPCCSATWAVCVCQQISRKQGKQKLSNRAPYGHLSIRSQSLTAGNAVKRLEIFWNISASSLRPILPSLSASYLSKTSRTFSICIWEVGNIRLIFLSINSNSSKSILPLQVE